MKEDNQCERERGLVELIRPETPHDDDDVDDDELDMSRSYNRNDTSNGHAAEQTSTGSMRLGWSGRWKTSRWSSE